MANALYAKGREGFLDGSIDWDTHEVRCAIVGQGYTPDLANHDMLDDVAVSIPENGRSAALDTKSVTGGVADAGDVVLAGVAAEINIKYIVIYKYNADDASARLIALIDTAGSLPFVTNGGDITIAWDNGANKIFKL